jgi:hypothetical protein
MLVGVRLIFIWEMRMSLRFITGVAVALAIASTPALACKGRNVAFSDDFSSEDPAWAGGDFTISNGRLQLKSDEGKLAIVVYEGDTLEAGDVCLDVIAPDYRGGGSEFAGILFGFGGQNLHAMWVSPADGTVGVAALKKGKWANPVPARKSDAIKQQANAVNTLRLTWKGGDGTGYVNDKQFAKFKIQPVPDANHFGIYAQTEGKVWQFDNYKVTD